MKKYADKLIAEGIVTEAEYEVCCVIVIAKIMSRIPQLYLNHNENTVCVVQDIWLTRRYNPEPEDELSNFFVLNKTKESSHNNLPIMAVNWVDEPQY